MPCPALRCVDSHVQWRFGIDGMEVRILVFTVRTADLSSRTSRGWQSGMPVEESEDEGRPSKERHGYDRHGR